MTKLCGCDRPIGNCGLSPKHLVEDNFDIPLIFLNYPLEEIMCFRIRSAIDNYYLIEPFLSHSWYRKIQKPIIAHDDSIDHLTILYTFIENQLLIH